MALFLILVVFFIIGAGVAFLPMMFDVPHMDILTQALSQIVIFGKVLARSGIGPVPCHAGIRLAYNG